MKHKILFFFLTVALISCGSGDDSPESHEDNQTVTNNPPREYAYELPENNQVCTGTILSNNTIEVYFQWNEFNDEDQSSLTYNLTILNLVTSEELYNQNLGGALSQTVVLEKGQSYGWKISATDDINQTTEGRTWLFQTPFDSISNYVPFPATLLSPILYEVISDNNIEITWEGIDPDQGETELLVYDLFLDVTNPPEVFAEGIETMSFNAVLNSGVYYWKVKSHDPNGNTSLSQTWQFIIE
jgi:hypothetical protein